MRVNTEHWIEEGHEVSGEQGSGRGDRNHPCSICRQLQCYYARCVSQIGSKKAQWHLW